MQRAAAHVIEHAARRADDDLRAARQLFDLPANRLAAVEGHRVDLAAVRKLDDFVADLHGQLARRHQDQGLRAVPFFGRLEPFQNRNHEGGRLAGAGAGLAQHVDAGQRARNQAGLNRRRLEIPGLLQSRHHGLGEREGPEIRERDWQVCLRLSWNFPTQRPMSELGKRFGRGRSAVRQAIS